MTYALVRDYVEAERVELTLKGKPEPVPAYRLIGVHASGRGARPTRTRRSSAARPRWTSCAARSPSRSRQRGARLVTVIGDAGVGKTRLIADFVGARRREAVVLRGRCLAYGDGITFWPLTEIVRQAAKIVGGRPARGRPRRRSAA